MRDKRTVITHILGAVIDEVSRQTSGEMTGHIVMANDMTSDFDSKVSVSANLNWSE